MNRRQEIAVWVFGVLLALAVARSVDTLDLVVFSFRPAPPLAILGALAIYSLRGKGEPAQPRVLLAGLGATCLLAIASAIHAMGSALPSTVEIERELTAISRSTDQVADSIDDLRADVQGDQ